MTRRIRARVIAAILLLTFAAPSAVARAGDNGYEQFMSLTAEQRREAFARLPADQKAALKRTHAQRWLETHRAELSAGQVAAVEQAIDFVTPELYDGPQTEERRRREQEIRKRLECSIGRDRAAAAFVLMPEIPQPTPEGLGRVVDQWLGWFVDCVIG
ncbi:MAG: hypothetical protein HYU53_00165 [Acidobacteria bacterium]|nr:hypothetical protein [Acidobacteriota bacterium]